ncbi:transglycosylase SLT domain-containing protein [Novosphingobium sp. Gsoil 351]|nr:transglycosylase SLT domain-containing protein [Novosphingobium sp. Gsoil 351]
MIPLGLSLSLALVAATPVRAEPFEQWRGYIAEASQRFGIPESWIERVMRAESGGRTRIAGRPTTSPKGAMGLMQVMPATWAMLTRRHALGTDPHEPRANILAGAAYLRAMRDRFGYPGLFAAYNAGPERYAAYLSGRQSLPGETRLYLVRTTGLAPSISPGSALEGQRPTRGHGLFVLRRDTGVPPLDDEPEGANRRGQSLFVELGGR